MNIIINLLWSAVIATFAFIAVCSFVSWGFDPASWTQAARAMLLCLWFVLAMGAYLLVEVISGGWQ